MTDDSAPRPVREPAPPTMVQDPDTARRAGAPVGAQRPPTIVQRPESEGSAAAHAADFPDELRDRFDPLALCGTGSEGAVWRVARLGGADGDGRYGAVKIHWAGRPVDAELVGHLREHPEFQRHAPAIGESGSFITASGPRQWVELEYLPRSLSQLIEDERVRGGGLPPTRVRELLAELAAVIAFWHEQIGRNPLDFKPDNLLVRPGTRDRGVQLVLADLGGAAAFRASQTLGAAMTTLAYAPPERLWNEKRSPWPWWSLGEIVYELVTGVPRYRSADGALKADSTLTRDRVLGQPDLSAVTDPRWRLLIAGLLTQDPDDRWAGRQVRLWLDGGDPPVAAPRVAPPEPVTAAPAHRPIAFHGRSYHDPAELARALTESWSQAGAWLTGANGAARLERWLRDEVKDTAHDLAYLGQIARDPASAQLAVTAIAAAYAPDLPPRYQGRAVDADGLPQELVKDSGGAFARELAERGVLAVAAQWRCSHPQCAAGGRCIPLDLAATIVSGAVVEARSHAAAAADGGVGAGLNVTELDRVYQAATLVALRPSMRHNLVRLPATGWGSRRVFVALSAPFAGPLWWRKLRRAAWVADPADARGAGTIAAAAALSERALRYRVAATSPRRDGRTIARHARAGLGEAAITTFAAALLGWTAAMMRGLVETSEYGTSSVIGRFIGRTAGEYQYQYFGLFICAGLFAAALTHALRTTLPLFLAPLIAGAMPGLVSYVPRFSAFELPGSVEQRLTDVGGFWGEGIAWVGFGYVVLAVFLCRRAVRLARGSGGLPRRRAARRGPFQGFGRAYPGAAPYAGFLLLLASFTALSWATAVVCSRAYYGSLSPIGGAPDDQLGRFALLLLVLAALGTYAVRRNGSGWLLALGAVVVYGTVRPLWGMPGVIGWRVFGGLIDWFDQLCGQNVFWVALALVVVVLCFGLPAARNAVRS